MICERHPDAQHADVEEFTGTPENIDLLKAKFPGMIKTNMLPGRAAFTRGNDFAFLFVGDAVVRCQGEVYVVRKESRPKLWVPIE